MATVKAFKGIRPSKQYAEEIVSLPYDVMDREEAKEMAGNKRYNFLHVCRSEIDLPGENPYSKKVYLKAKDKIREWIDNGILIEEEAETLYIYKQTMKGNSQTGIVGCVSVDDYETGVIKKHETTRTEKELDRINHFDVCNMNTESVFLMYRDDVVISELIDNYVNTKKPEYNFIDENKVGHAFWVIRDNKIVQRITEEFNRIPNLYIADGHHRSASAYRVGKMRRKENQNYTGKEEFNFFMAVLFPESELNIYDYNRVITGLNGLKKDELIEAIKHQGFSIKEISSEAYRPKRKHEFSMYLDGIWYSLTAQDNIIPEDVILRLDVSILQDNILKPILGIDDPRTSDNIDFVGGIRGLEELAKRADNSHGVAFSLYPVSTKEIMDVSDNDRIMPPKSTWFEPKLGSGLFMHRL